MMQVYNLTYIDLNYQNRKVISLCRRKKSYAEFALGENIKKLEKHIERLDTAVNSAPKGKTGYAKRVTYSNWKTKQIGILQRQKNRHKNMINSAENTAEQIRVSVKSAPYHIRPDEKFLNFNLGVNINESCNSHYDDRSDGHPAPKIVSKNDVEKNKLHSRIMGLVERTDPEGTEIGRTTFVGEEVKERGGLNNVCNNLKITNVTPEQAQLINKIFDDAHKICLE